MGGSSGHRMPKSLVRRPIVKKRTKKFKRFQADRFKRISRTSWRRPRGIDCRVRRKFRGVTIMPNIGYGSSRKTEHMHRSGFYRFLVKCPKDLEMLMMHNGVFAAELAHELSAKTRKAIIERADQLNIKALNRSAKFTTEENE